MQNQIVNFSRIEMTEKRKRTRAMYHILISDIILYEDDGAFNERQAKEKISFAT